MLSEIEQFIDHVRIRSPQAKTWRDYKCDLELFSRVVGDLAIQDIHPRQLDEFVNYQINRGYKPGTVNRRLSAVASLYRFLIAEGKADRCPVLQKRHYLREPERLPRPVNEKDLRKFFATVDNNRDWAMFTLMLRCGLRIGEVAALKIPDLYLGETPSRMIIHGKGSRERTVYLSTEAERALRSWLAQRPAGRDEHVFLSYKLKKLSTNAIQVRVSHVGKVSGVDLTAHNLRHTFADHLLSAGVPITSIQKLMGHRFVATTQNYAVANDQQVQADFYQACEKLEGWQILSFDAQLLEPETNSQNEAEQEKPDVPQSIPIPLPARISRLSVELIGQLEAFRQLNANRWRVERVPANSIKFYCVHGIMWQYFYDEFEVKTASELKLAHVRQFIKSRLDAGRSISTVNISLSSLRCFLYFLKEDDIFIHPSLDGIQRLKEIERLPRYLTSEQVRRLKDQLEENLSQADTLPKRYDATLMRAIFYLLWQCGLRSGEVKLLRFSDFYFYQANQTRRLFIGDSKWRKGRSVYLTDAALKALNAYLKLRGVEKPDDFVFVRNGMALKRDFISIRLRRVGRQVNVSVTPHRLRHTFATQLLNVGCKITSIQKLLGHTDLNTTMIYSQAFDQTVMLDYFKAVDAMEIQPDGAWFGLNESSTTRE